MSLLSNVKREAYFLSKQRYICAFIFVALLLSIFSVCSGINETQTQQATIERLKQKDTLDRTTVQAQQTDYGSAAYYSFHLTYSNPSEMAFAAMGQRDIYPWKHRIRMLAIEGQIYETDAENPELSFLGKFDFAFLISVLLPLFVILLLHDLRASEREAGRYDLLITTARKRQQLWLSRALVICSALSIAILVPFIIGAWYSNAPLTAIALSVGVVIAHLIFWMLVTLLFTASKTAAKQSSAQTASVLLAFWLGVTVLMPVVSDIAIEEMVPSPNGGEIVLVQREAVNGAWDQPFETTWQAFLSRYPQWAHGTHMDSLFEWKWYYAFQQVGDQKAQPLSNEYRDAIIKKHTLAGYFSLFSPPMLAQRLMSSIAETDTLASLKYEQTVRDYHQALRLFYYPLLFNETAFSQQKLSEIPEFSLFEERSTQIKENN
ncbi:DUF3526 domain-containing protein [Shewanella intestini]|uniref:DUF3526 domain-containing protein n=1 Tax=Shewanella intestini TaxID=2017544 RepID=A0ABS5I294_9GAMM|nr:MULTISPECIES: DUF3526 domain-containing protein [Shewanella]MBR9728146.1 DUF3526 domain-containing protein [Shewanella intestini]MRG36617.1 DUF3526 domain-containing protein [Shewanella sp. XMDDZSB0408]